MLLDPNVDVCWHLWRREVKARKAANKAAKGTSVAQKAKPMASKQKGGNVM